MPLKVQKPEEPTLNLTPMIDIVFLLVIFFMVGARFTELEQEFDIDLPTVSDSRPLTSPPDAINVNILRDGRINVGGTYLSMKELRNTLEQARIRYADQSVLIRGDGKNMYQRIIDVLSVCQQAKIRHFSLAARLDPEDSP